MAGLVLAVAQDGRGARIPRRPGPHRDAELGGDGAGLVHVELGDLGAGDLADDLFEDGTLHAARTAPRGPEVHQDQAGLGFGGEVAFGEFENSCAHDGIPFVGLGVICSRSRRRP